MFPILPSGVESVYDGLGDVEAGGVGGLQPGQGGPQLLLQTGQRPLHSQEPLLGSLQHNSGGPPHCNYDHLLPV